ncbi:YdiU family protein [Cereibacter azotoformans]|uniref:Protein nucleotidyltransferase YdiU n=1 Tax=Cereibacter sphaeroides (strain ATCC 17025 / ATH 2.4.3) TaxID=349102 RepID=SELO_CERS5|nr:YdiU family protein [Cereibacter azotoformans]A4WTS8.1 RecName: Full=Protein adenylyltransferase SelO [Cereibacter sphaeroides ATCC 17025]ULB10038.1 YdiU family protein [Cereibacter azotoformans]
MTFRFDNSYARELEGFYVDWQAAPVPAPRLLRLNRGLAGELGLDADRLEAEGAAIFSGKRLPEGAHPLAQAYAGHQFGGFSPQLGDGRALLIGEVTDRSGRRRDLQLKGSGRTPFSRGADGKATLGPVLREYLVGEAMHGLGIPTTRALAAVATGEPVLRQAGELPGAILTRVAASHIRVGTFQFFAARSDMERVRRLADYAIARHYPALAEAPEPYLAFYEAVADAQADLVARWMLVGFIHGVMNTDNMAISGETIDYGPCAFMEGFDPGTVFSSIDLQGRYAYGNQPFILAWNLARLGEALLPLFDADAGRAAEKANAVLGTVGARYQARWLEGMRAKLGLAGAEEGDLSLAEDLLAAMQGARADWTLTFRRLADAVTEDAALRPVLQGPDTLQSWLSRWRRRLGPEAARRIRAVNPIYIARNHRVEEALAAAHAGDLGPFDRLIGALSDPFTERAGLEDLAQPAPAGFNEGYRTFCGT